uniref:Uncharacterized protein n=2 Tax=Aegilops tauschii subsp. strangulata TaxID=200361 RepID=A0A453AK00_AEGTS
MLLSAIATVSTEPTSNIILTLLMFYANNWYACFTICWCRAVTTRSLAPEPLLPPFAQEDLESLARNQNQITISTTSFVVTTSYITLPFHIILLCMFTPVSS